MCVCVCVCVCDWSSLASHQPPWVIRWEVLSPCARQYHIVLCQDAVYNDLQESSKQQEDDWGEELADVGANGAELQSQVLQELQGRRMNTRFSVCLNHCTTGPCMAYACKDVRHACSQLVLAGALTHQCSELMPNGHFGREVVLSPVLLSTHLCSHGRLSVYSTRGSYCAQDE